MQYFHITASEPLYTNTFLILTKNKKAAIIDPAANVKEYELLLEAHDAKLTHVLLTHGHFDHTSSAIELSKKHSAPIYLGEGDSSSNRLFPMKNGEFTPYKDGEKIIVDEDCIFEVIATPGHSKGSVCLLCESEKLMFTGDTLFANNIGRCDLEGSNYETMLKSLKKLQEKVDDTVEVLPGHGEFSQFGYEKENNQYFKK